MARVSPFRSLIAILLAAWMPFCCCSLQSLVSVCHACEEHGDDDGASSCHGHALAHQHAVGQQHHDEDATPDHQDQPKRDHGPCTCDKSKLTTIGVVKITIDFPAPVLAYVLPEWEPYRSLSGESLAICRENRALRKPTTSLLYQHCALIV